MALRLGDVAPDFEAQTTQGNIKFHEWLGSSWGMLFSHPADFTPVCTTELGKTALLKGEFEKRNVKPIAVSVDDLDSHHRWVPDINEVNGVEVNFPIIADGNRNVATLYDMIHPNASEKATVRSVFVIGPDKKIKLSLQLTAHHQVATPADWKTGEDVIVIPAVSTEDAQKKYSDLRIVKPYLRYTAQPEK
ncbi:MAG: peroxiredoxin [Spirosomaceae bacterium]|nr:peroxiredoxin [Spirosomataceae bacterium]